MGIIPSFLRNQSIRWPPLPPALTGRPLTIIALALGALTFLGLCILAVRQCRIRATPQHNTPATPPVEPPQIDPKRKPLNDVIKNMIKEWTGGLKKFEPAIDSLRQLNFLEVANQLEDCFGSNTIDQYDTKVKDQFILFLTKISVAATISKDPPFAIKSSFEKAHKHFVKDLQIAERKKRLSYPALCKLQALAQAFLSIAEDHLILPS